MSSPIPKDDGESIAATNLAIQTKEWVKFEEGEEGLPAASSTPNKVDNVDESQTNIPALIKSESVTVNVSNINKTLDIRESEQKKNDNYSGAVIATNSVQINLDRSGLNRSMKSDGDEPNLQSSITGVYKPKSASLKTIDLRDGSNGRNIISTPIGNIRQGFANGDTIVTLLPVNTKWPWITPARFRPELVPEELMAQGLTLTVEDYVHIMELLVNDIRFNMYNICYKRILVVWIFTAFIVLLGLLFSGVTGLTLFGLGVMWLILNAAAIFLCMFVKIKLNQNLEKCMAQVNKHLLRHKILLGLDDRGKISCHKVNLCFIYFDTTDCIKKLQEIIEREEREGRVISNDEGSRSRRQQELHQRMDIDDSDIVIQGATTTRVSRKQERAELLLLRYASRWSHHFVQRRLNLAVDSQERSRGNSIGLSVQPPRHCISARCPCQFIEEHLKYKPKAINVKKRWECIRKSYANALRKNREQYVYFNQMDFLKEFILLQDADKYLDKENDEIESKVMPSSLFSVHQRKTLNLFDKFSRAETSSKNVLSEKSSNAFSKVAGTSTLNNAFTKKKEDEIELLQKQIVIAAQDTMKSVEKSGKDCFEIAIMETLRLVNENRLINCLPGVFDILLEYQNKK